MSLNLRDEYHGGALPGEYQVLVVFRGARGREEAPEGVRLWTAEEPELKAGPLTIKVVEERGCNPGAAPPNKPMRPTADTHLVIKLCRAGRRVIGGVRCLASCELKTSCVFT